MTGFPRYWAFNKSDIPGLPLLYSFGRTLRCADPHIQSVVMTYLSISRYHTGTLAFGSLIIAIIKMIRLMLQYIQDKLEEKGADNPVVKVGRTSLPDED